MPNLNVVTLRPTTGFREFTYRILRQGEQVIGVAWDGKKKQVSRQEGADASEVELALKEDLLSKSSSYIGIEGAISVFEKVYPKGFSDPFYLDVEREYKVKATTAIKSRVTSVDLPSALESPERTGELVKEVRRLFGMTDIVHTVEKAKFFDALKVAPERILLALDRVLRSDNRWNAFDEFAQTLRENRALNWPNATYLLFTAQPDRWLFIKPWVLQTCADRLGWELGYSSEVSADNYQSLLAFGDRLKEALKPLEPRDYIDVHTFIFATNATGYVAEMLPGRKKWEQASKL